MRTVSRSKRIYFFLLLIGFVITAANIALYFSLDTSSSSSNGGRSRSSHAASPWWRTGVASWTHHKLRNHSNIGSNLFLSNKKAENVPHDDQQQHHHHPSHRPSPIPPHHDEHEKPPETKHPLPPLRANVADEEPTSSRQDHHHHRHHPRQGENDPAVPGSMPPSTLPPPIPTTAAPTPEVPEGGSEAIQDHRSHRSGHRSKHHKHGGDNDHKDKSGHPPQSDLNRENEARSEFKKKREKKRGQLYLDGPEGGGSSNGERDPHSDTPRPQTIDRHHRHGKPPKYVAGELGASVHEKTADFTFVQALEKYDVFLKENVGEEVEQSSNRFRDIAERSDGGIALPTTDVAQLQSLFGLEESNILSSDSEPHDLCDPRNADYTRETDTACIKYLGNVQNMYSVKPMSSFLSTGRTIKFKLYYKHRNITAVLKVSQKKFALEPASEAIAFQMDRYLNLNRVPPVTWTSIPLDFLKAGAASMDAFYVQWFHKFVVEYDTNARHLIHSTTYLPDGVSANSHSRGGGGEHAVRSIKVSIQLWMADVRNAEETAMRPSEAFKRYLSLPTPQGDAEVVRERLAPALPNGAVNYKRLSVAELMDEFLFDAVIGNSDRWFGHNSFALGGCEDPKAPCAATAESDYRSGKRVKSLSKPRLAFIDQGSSFYRHDISDMNPFSSKFLSLCRFRKSTAERILEIFRDAPKLTEAEEEAYLRFKSEGGEPVTTKIQDKQTIVYQAVRKELPPGVFMVHSVDMLRAAGNRMAMLEAHIRSCARRFPAEDVFFF